MKKLDPLNLVIIGAVVVAVGIGGYLYFVIAKPTLPSLSYVSPYILDFTTPSYAFSGKVTKVSTQSFTVTKVIDNTSQAPVAVRTGRIEPNSKLSPAPIKKVSLQVKMTDKTQVNKDPQVIPYLFGQIPAEAKNQNAQKPNMVVGDLVTVNTQNDIRTTNPNSLVASSIDIFTQPFRIDGIVSSVQGNTITLNGTYAGTTLSNLIQGGQPTPKDYTIKIASDTQIGQAGPITPGKPGSRDVHLNAQDIAMGSRLTVYSDQDVSVETTINARVIVVAPTVLAIPAAGPNTNVPQ